MVELSLFTDDPLRRFFRKVGLEKNGLLRNRLLVFAIFASGWLIPFILSAIEGHAITDNIKEPFIYDINQPVQVIGLSFLVFAESYIDIYIKNAGIILYNSGLIRDIRGLEKNIRQVTSLRKSILFEIICLIIGIFIMLTWAFQLKIGNVDNWLVQFHHGKSSYTIAGWWMIFTFELFIQYYCTRWAWKVVIWTIFLYQISKKPLNIAVGHPDRVGGLRFIGDTQKGFGILIFVVGSMIVAFSLQEILVDKSSIFNVWIPLLLFVLLAPCLFLAPMLMFTKQLYLSKMKGLLQYDILLTRYINAFEAQHISSASTSSNPLELTQDLRDLSGIVNLSNHVTSMRIIPFDLNTLFRLFASAVSPMLPLVSKFLPWSKISNIFEAFLK